MKALIKLTKKLTIALTLLSLLVPTTLTLINVKAQESNHQQINVEITNKDGSKEVETTTIENLGTNSIIKTPTRNEIPQLESNPEQIQELQTSGAIVYDENDFASLVIPVLQNLGYSQSEIEELEKLRDNYNSIPVKEVKITTNSIKSNPASFGINVSAACEYEVRTREFLLWTEIYMNNCLIKALLNGVIISDGLIALMAASKVAAVAAVATAPAVLPVLVGVTTYVGVMDNHSGQCNDEGANLNVTNENARRLYTLPLAWTSSVC